MNIFFNFIIYTTLGLVQVLDLRAVVTFWVETFV